jgi:uncharacterized membrane protein
MRIETIGDVRQYARLIRVQAVQSNAMPLGNETRMSVEDRERLGAWLGAQK